MKSETGPTIGLIGVCGLLALAAVAMSGIGGERFTVILAASALSVAVAGIGFIITVMHGVVSRACSSLLLRSVLLFLWRSHTGHFGSPA